MRYQKLKHNFNLEIPQVHGWKINLEFDSPLDRLDCYMGDVESSSDKVGSCNIPGYPSSDPLGGGQHELER